MLEIAPQCCDAGSYIQYGSECAVNGVCHGPLRPMGDYLWFAIPPLLDLPLKSLVLANLVLIAISVLLSVAALVKLWTAEISAISRRVFIATIFIASLAVHIIYTFPTAFNTLSDTPANMFLLSGIWLLILAHYNKFSGMLGEMQALLSGLALGCSAWLRAFYLYPVLAGLAIFFFIWCISKKKVYEELLLLVALLPIGTQFVTMHKAYGSYTYLNEETTSNWTGMHLYQPFVGYDTIFPRNDYVWRPRHCGAKLGVINGLKAGEYKGVACVLAERINFYLGTYEPDTYIFSDRINQLVPRLIESIGAPKTDWRTTNLAFEGDSAIAPSGEAKADKLIVTNPSPDGAGDVVMWVMLKGGTLHTFSVWLWAPIENTVNLAIKRHDDDKPIALQRVTISPQPQRYFVTGKTLNTTMYDIDIGRTPYADKVMSFGQKKGDLLYAWGAQLEHGDAPSDFHNSGIIKPDSVREWRLDLLFLNIAAIIIAVLSIIRVRSFWLEHRAGICILTIMATSAVECIAIIPEQRFAIGVMIFMWVFPAPYFASKLKKHNLLQANI